MHTLMSNQQYYQALGSSSIVNKEGLNSEYGHPSLPQRGHLGSEGSSHVLLPLPALWLTAEDFEFYKAKSIHFFLLLSWDFVTYLRSPSPSQY